MKKITALLIAVIMIAAVFAGTTSAFKDDVMPDGFHWVSVDWYAYAGSFLSQAGHCEDLVRDNPQTYDLFSDPNADVVGFYGWAALTEGEIKSYAYSLDNGARVESPLSRLQDASLDRTAELQNAGITNGEGFWIVYNYSSLKAGKHNAAFYAIDASGQEHLMFSYDFNVVERYPDQWFCSTGNTDVTPGYWSYPLAEGHEFTLTFPSAYTFGGFCIFFYANPEGSTVDISLLDKDGKELETFRHTQIDNGALTHNFSKAYGPGTYTLRIVSVSHSGETGWFVVGSKAAGEMQTTIGGNFTTNDQTLPAVFGFLIGAAKEQPAEEEPGTDPTPGTTEPTNPHTADASVVAIAAVACAALAGAFIVKKVR